MVRIVGLCLALAVGLSACGDNASPPGGGASSQSAEDVAGLAKCSGSYKDTGSDKMMFSADGGTCSVDSSEVTISWFKSTEARDNYKQMGDSMGGGDPVVYGKNWAIECTDLEPCKTVADRTGGKLD